MRIEGIYQPYHATLQKLLGEALAVFGVAVLIDCHSMPRWPAAATGPPPISSWATATAPPVRGPMLVDLAETVFTAAGLRVARNRPYAGGFATRTYGRPQHGVHALQIEISRHLYMSEVTLEKNEGFEAMRQPDRAAGRGG